MLSTIIAGLALGAIVFFAVRYIVKQKRKGVKCIGLSGSR
ncbi:FeoB-associated Cys-rich membrane protein [uncultured Arcanobacterium sp.]